MWYYIMNSKLDKKTPKKFKLSSQTAKAKQKEKRVHNINYIRKTNIGD